MKTRYLLPVLVLAALLSADSFSQEHKFTATKTDRFNFSAGGTVVLTAAPVGSVTIVGSSKNEVEITATIEVTGGSEADMAKVADASGFAVIESISKTVIGTAGPHNKFGQKKVPKEFSRAMLSLPVRIDYVIRVPRYTDLEIDGGKGGLSIKDVEGSMNVNFLESDALIEVVGGSTFVSIGKGSLDIAFGVRGWRSRAATVSVGTGDLTARLPASTSAEVDAAVMKNGSIVNNLTGLTPRDRRAPFTERSIAARAGVGGSPLKFTVGDGTLTLDRLVPR